LSDRDRTERIESIIERGSEGGLESLASPVERWIFLISEAEVLCDMEGIDAFLNTYSAALPEAADSFAAAGAADIAESLRAIHTRLPDRPDDLLDRASDLVSARTGYDDSSVARLLSDR